MPGKKFVMELSWRAVFFAPRRTTMFSVKDRRPEVASHIPDGKIFDCG
jgi:hypothetical protein